MWDLVAAWPASVWVAILPLAGGALWKPLTFLVNLLLGREARGDRRITTLEELVDELRRALDKNLIRENALASCCDVLIFAIDHIADPAPAIVHLRARALSILESAQKQLLTGGE